jgi:hypothetical protein
MDTSGHNVYWEWTVQAFPSKCVDTHWLAEEMWVDHGKDGETSNYEDGRNQKMLLML